MKISNNALNIATLSKIKGIGNAWIAQNFQADSSEAEIIERVKRQIKKQIEILQQKKDLSDKEKEEKIESLSCDYENTTTLFKNCKKQVESKLDSLENYADGVIAFCDSGFPTYSAKIKDSDKPILLTYKGDLGLLTKDSLRIAVIGLLNPCDKIKHLEQKIIDKMLQKDAVIVSGLAKGCDEIAHRFTLQKNGATIAILPSTLQHILPSTNAELAQEIAINGGLLISEYITECDNPRFGLLQRYIERDRLQALFSDAVCLVASFSENDSKKDKSKDSGSRHALNKAKEWGIMRITPKGIEKEWGIMRITPKGIENDERFNLNKEILSDKKSPAIEINAENVGSVVEKIVKSKQSKQEKQKQTKKEQPKQNSLWNLDN